MQVLNEKKREGWMSEQMEGSNEFQTGRAWNGEGGIQMWREHARAGFIILA